MIKYISRHEFQIGREYQQRSAASDKDYLNAVLGAEKTLSENMVQTNEGIYWKDVLQEEPDRAFYSGSAGILYFYIKLYKAFRDQKYMEVIEGALDYLINTWDRFQVADMSSPLPEAGNGFYTGISAVTIPLIEAYDILDDDAKKEQIKSTVRKIYHAIVETAKEENGALYWRKNLAMFYDGGVLLQLLQIAEFLEDDDITANVLKSGRLLADTAYESKGGGLVYDGYNGENEYVAPNFEFGSAGSGYVLLKLYEMTQDGSYLDKALKCYDFLQEISIKQSKGVLIPYRYGRTDQTIYYLGACHGPAGTGKFFYKLYQVTQDKKYLDALYELYGGLEALGGPTKMSAGLWNCVNLCCGAAAHVQAYIGLYVSTKDRKWFTLAEKSADILLGEMENGKDGAVYWPVALDRIAPTVFTVPMGYYDGTAGIASALLQMYLLKEGRFTWKRLVDDPFLENNEEEKGEG